MLRRLCIAALLSWGVLAIPALCRAGMLEHACDCGVSANCGHEESCSDDPCVMAKPTTDAPTPVQAFVFAPVLAALLPIAEVLATSETDLLRSVRGAPLVTSIALRSGARPLLI